MRTNTDPELALTDADEDALLAIFADADWPDDV